MLQTECFVASPVAIGGDVLSRKKGANKIKALEIAASEPPAPALAAANAAATTSESAALLAEPLPAASCAPPPAAPAASPAARSERPGGASWRTAGPSPVETAAGASAADEMLEALDAALDESRRRARAVAVAPACDAGGGGEAGEALDPMMKLVSSAAALSISGVVAVVCGLSLIIYQLRARYTEGVGSLVLALLGRIAQEREPLPRPASGADARMAVLRLLEGVVLVHTVQHAREESCSTLEGLLRRKRHVLPMCVSARLEAALVCFDPSVGRPGVPAASAMDADGGESVLYELLKTLEPDAEGLRLVKKAQAMLEEAVSTALHGSCPDYFGSAVNGFAIMASDVDCVVVLNDDCVEALLRLDPVLAKTCRRSDDSIDRRHKSLSVAAAHRLASTMRTHPASASWGFVVKEVVTEARVPLLKCQSADGVDVDVSFNNSLPLYNSRLLRTYADIDLRVRGLGRLVKWWAKQRQVNDAQEGTLSSYSYTLLVIHYLQHVNFLPNLQDKSNAPEEGLGDTLVDVLHDVWFLDAAGASKNGLLTAALASTATLRGLLAGFFRYYAYEFPAHSEVVSIRLLGGRVTKTDFFAQLAAASVASTAIATCAANATAARLVEAASAGTEAVEEEHIAADAEVEAVAESVAEGQAEKPTEAEGVPTVQAATSPPDSADDSSDSEEVFFSRAPCAHQETNKDDADTYDARDAANAEGPELALTRLGNADAASELAPLFQGSNVLSQPGQRVELTSVEQAAQRHLSNRLVLCIDDPIESGRTLGAGFQGMERIAYELRRACHLSYEGCDGLQLVEIFREETYNSSLRALMDKHPLPNVFAQARGVTQGTHTKPGIGATGSGGKGALKGASRRELVVPQYLVGRVMGKAGATIQEMQRWRGMSSVRLIDGHGPAADSKLILAGTAAAVEECAKRVKVLLQDAITPHEVAWHARGLEQSQAKRSEQNERNKPGMERAEPGKTSMERSTAAGSSKQDKRVDVRIARYHQERDADGAPEENYYNHHADDPLPSEVGKKLKKARWGKQLEKAIARPPDKEEKQRGRAVGLVEKLKPVPDQFNAASCEKEYLAKC